MDGVKTMSECFDRYYGLRVYDLYTDENRCLYSILVTCVQHDPASL